MERRTFMAMVSGGLLAMPLAAGAQQAVRMPRIGVLVTGSEDTMSSDPSVAAFRQGLRDLGYVEGQNVAMEYRYSSGRTEGVPKLVVELIGLNVDVIVAAGGPMALVAKNATRTIPIVFIAAGDPVGSGIVASLARPAGNATGLSLPVDADFRGKWMALLKEAVPRISHVGYFQDLNVRRLPEQDLSGLQGAAQRLGLKLRYVEVHELREIDSMLATMSKERGGVIVPQQPFFFTYRSEMTKLAAKHRLPAIYGFRILWTRAASCPTG